jgi:hypothetical protein
VVGLKLLTIMVRVIITMLQGNEGKSAEEESARRSRRRATKRRGESTIINFPYYSSLINY